MNELPDKNYQLMDFVKYNKNKYGLIWEDETGRNEIIMNSTDAKALAGKMLMLIDVSENLTKHNSSSKKDCCVECGKILLKKDYPSYCEKCFIKRFSKQYSSPS